MEKSLKTKDESVKAYFKNFKGKVQLIFKAASLIPVSEFRVTVKAVDEFINCSGLKCIGIWYEIKNVEDENGVLYKELSFSVDKCLTPEFPLTFEFFKERQEEFSMEIIEVERAVSEGVYAAVSFEELV